MKEYYTNLLLYHPECLKVRKHSVTQGHSVISEATSLHQESYAEATK
jgi:hypothetical protein